MENARKVELLKRLTDMLVDERARMMGEPMDAGASEDAGQLWTLFRVLVNVRPPLPAPDGFVEMQDELLQGLIAEAGVATLVDAHRSPRYPHLLMWRGDITTFAADAIVNAANSQMLGCWQPGHHCIDNAIHTYAGIQLRRECADVMEAQGHEEPTGQAKLTGAYNLPAKHVIHTVGPIANGNPSDRHRRQLAQCYRSCLDCAQEAGLESIAFCCISTGVFGFPQEEAATIAVRTVSEWIDEHDMPMDVVFNVFSGEDEDYYRALLR